MPKTTYQPTENDRLTGLNVRRLRRAAGETLQETIDRSGIDLKQSSLSRTELGQRQLTVPEATMLAAHFRTTAEKIIARPQQPVTEQEWLGNEPTPVLRAVSGAVLAELNAVAANQNVLSINLDQPLTPDEYREQVWIPYLEQRYAQELKQTG